MKPLVKDERLEGPSQSMCPSFAVQVQKDVWTFAKALAVELAARHPGVDDVRVPRGQTAAGPRVGGLQPERLGPDAGEHLFRQAAAACLGVHAVDLGRSCRRAQESTTFASITCASGLRASAISGSRFSAAKGRTDLAKFLTTTRRATRRRA
jgi:hypothetical protein